jgi:Leucine-rich repeat (LRR) protein
MDTALAELKEAIHNAECIIKDWIEQNDETVILSFASLPLKTIPDNIPKNVKQISIEFTEIEKIDTSKLPPVLEVLICTSSCLKYIPPNLPSTLRMLYVDSTHISEITESLPPNLEYLDCKWNNISYLPENLPIQLYIECVCNHIPDNMIRIRNNHDEYTMTYTNHINIWKQWHANMSMTRCHDRVNVLRKELLKYYII